MKVLHLTINGTPHHVRCGADGRKAVGCWPSHVPGQKPEPPDLAEWLRKDGWRWCGSCMRLDRKDRSRDFAILEVERVKNRIAMRESHLS